MPEGAAIPFSGYIAYKNASNIAVTFLIGCNEL